MSVIYHLILSFLAITSVASLPTGNKPYSQQALDLFNVLKHQGGHGPYSEHPGFGIDRSTPDQCTVDQVQLFIRHGERYPTVDLGNSLTKLLQQIKDNQLVARNDLAFLNHYRSPALMPKFYEKETFMGPYGGYPSMFLCGSEIRSRYGHLWNEDSTVPFFTASQERIVITAVNVARGFFGSNWKNHTHLVVLNETAKSGLNSLTPVDGCPAFDGGYKGDYHALYGQIGLNNALKRFQEDLPGINATTEDIGNLMSLCMYDLNAVGSSPLCEYFTADDWKAFEYKRDLDYYYFSGNGNPAVPALGGVVSNATLTLLQSEDSIDDRPSIYFSFSHEANILMYLTAVGLVNPPKDLEWSSVDFTNRWTTSHLVPMGTRVALERLVCKNETDPLVTEKFVRFVINDAVIPHDICTSGPGFSCPLEEYLAIQESRIPSAIEKCNIDDSYTDPKELTFYWDWETNPDKYKNTVVDLDDF